MKINDYLVSIKKYLLDLIYPPRCPFCTHILKEGEYWCCVKCEAVLPKCGKNSIQNFHGFKCYSPLYYKDSVREALLRYKFGGHNSYYYSFAHYISECVDFTENRFDCITWVPLNRKRLKNRGFDQSQLIAEELSEISGVPCKKLLEKTVNNNPQSSSGSKESRIKNVTGVYSLGKFEVPKNVLIIDDIVTTGSTLSECVKVLVSGGAESITAATVARHED